MHPKRVILPKKEELHQPVKVNKTTNLSKRIKTTNLGIKP
jgi:hypothetical protein